MICIAKKQLRAGVTAGLFVFVGLVATGCPSFTFEQISLAEGSVTADRFTVEALVSVLEEDPAVDDEENLSGGRGILGIWLPPGWSADEARVMDPQESGFTALQPISDADGHFPPTFPHAPGNWFAFVSACDNIAEGEFEYLVQVDVSGDGSSSEVTMGIAAALFDDTGSRGPVPTEVSVDLHDGTVTIAKTPASPASANLDECEPIPYGDTPTNDECSCSAPGSPRQEIELLELLFLVF
jgi:hypothetical protein